MFCLRSWLPLLFIPTNASPAFIFLFFLCTYFLNRPCLYCSFLLLVLFLTSCNWSDRCFFDFASNWFETRPGASYIYLPCTLPGGCCGDAACGSISTGSSSSIAEEINSTASAVVTEILKTTTGSKMASAATEQIDRARTEWTGLGMEWMRSLLGRREWRIDCLDVNIRL